MLYETWYQYCGGNFWISESLAYFYDVASIDFFMSKLLFVNVATDCLMSDEKILIGRPHSNSGDFVGGWGTKLAFNDTSARIRSTWVHAVGKCMWMPLEAFHPRPVWWRFVIDVREPMIEILDLDLHVMDNSTNIISLQQRPWVESHMHCFSAY